MSVILTVGMAFSSSGFAIRSVTRFEHLPRYLLASFLLTFGIGFGLECDLVVDSIIYLHIYRFWSIGLQTRYAGIAGSLYFDAPYDTIKLYSLKVLLIEAQADWSVQFTMQALSVFILLPMV
ncbi:hypothetical protein M9H77_16593 [Catharanthus roseus]|uniref:Uncharacterized protein n=1 Tax=Catharanthus roseus TaxID=4058 RepID=A0ACC0B263_CATRO|nr:hypothetical protein M9H77_16593 [Catharanthus roseus]